MAGRPGMTKTRPGPRYGPRVPPAPERSSAVWGRMIRTAYEDAHENRDLDSPGWRRVLEPQRSALIDVIRAAYADGWTYGELERRSGVCQRVLRSWAQGGWSAAPTGVTPPA